MNRILPIIAANFVFSFGNPVQSQTGFDDEAVIEALSRNTARTGASVCSIIEAVTATINPDDMVRFMITCEGELCFLSCTGQLYVAVAVEQLGGFEPKVLLCSSDVEALEKRTSGFAFVSDDIFGEDALTDQFSFERVDTPEKPFEAFCDEYEEMHPELRKARKKLKRCYLGQTKKKKHKVDREEAAVLLLGVGRSATL